MSLPHLESVPKKAFLFRMIRPAVFVYFLAFLLMGAISSVNAVDSKESGVRLPAFEMARYQHSKLVRQLVSGPEVCWSGKTVSEFQDRQCRKYWTEVALGGFWVAFPLLIVAIGMQLGLSVLVRVYEQAAKNLRLGQGGMVGIVTEPAEMPNDLFGWLFCMRSIAVQLPSKKQLRVYTPMFASIPDPGSRFAVVSIGKRFGENRYVGVSYAPHVAVFVGSKG